MPRVARKAAHLHRCDERINQLIDELAWRRLLKLRAYEVVGDYVRLKQPDCFAGVPAEALAAYPLEWIAEVRRGGFVRPQR